MLEVAVIVLVWQVVVEGLGLFSPRFVPPPSDVIEALARMAESGRLLRDVTYSLTNFVIGYGCAALVGIALGLFLGSRPRLWSGVGPFFWTAYATPRSAIQPILVLWLGFGIGPKVLIIFLMALFPIVFIIIEGVRETEPSLIKAGRVFGLDARGLATKIVLPAALPYVVTGLRLGLSRAMVGIVVGEFIGGTAGLGYTIHFSGREFALSTVIASTLVLAAIANVGLFVLEIVQRRLAPWYREVGIGLK